MLFALLIRMTGRGCLIAQFSLSHFYGDAANSNKRDTMNILYHFGFHAFYYVYAPLRGWYEAKYYSLSLAVRKTDARTEQQR